MGVVAHFGRTGLLRMLHGVVQQLVDDAQSLLAGCNEQFRQARNVRATRCVGSERAGAFSDHENPLSHIPDGPVFATGYEILSRLGQSYDKPGFSIAAIERNGCVVPVVEQVVLERALCRLLRFAPDPVALGAAAFPSKTCCCWSVRRWQGITPSCFARSSKPYGQSILSM